MKRLIAIAMGIGLAVAIIVLVSTGVHVLAVKIYEGLQGHCTSEAISEYEAVRDSISSEISEAWVERYDCEEGGYPFLAFRITGQPERVLDILHCANPKVTKTMTVYSCSSPRLGWLEVENGGKVSYSFDS